VFAGTSVTSPAPQFAISGNALTYLYHNSTLALDADTGEIVWQYVAVSTGSSLTAMGANRLTPELKPSLGNNLFVFALPD
jgi:outer membrane protein assembly factor BamB